MYYWFCHFLGASPKPTLSLHAKEGDFLGRTSSPKPPRITYADLVVHKGSMLFRNKQTNKTKHLCRNDQSILMVPVRIEILFFSSVLKLRLQYFCSHTTVVQTGLLQCAFGLKKKRSQCLSPHAYKMSLSPSSSLCIPLPSVFKLVVCERGSPPLLVTCILKGLV